MIPASSGRKAEGAGNGGGGEMRDRQGAFKAREERKVSREKKRVNLEVVIHLVIDNREEKEVFRKRGREENEKFRLE